MKGPGLLNLALIAGAFPFCPPVGLISPFSDHTLNPMMIKNLHITLFIMIGLSMFFGSANAFETEVSIMRFGYKSVSVGDTVGELIEKFGQPYYKEKQTDYRFYDRRDRVIERDIFLWFYRIDKYSGYGSSNYRIMIYDGIIQKIVDID